jgi:hypothetical protein
MLPRRHGDQNAEEYAETYQRLDGPEVVGHKLLSLLHGLAHRPLDRRRFAAGETVIVYPMADESLPDLLSSLRQLAQRNFAKANPAANGQAVLSSEVQ